MSILRMLAASNVPPYVPPVQQYVTKTFTSSTSWTPPFGVTMLQTLTGKASDGAPGDRIRQNHVVTHLSYVGDFGGEIAGNLTWERATSTATDALKSLGGSSPYWNEWTLQQFAVSRYNYSNSQHIVTDYVYGSAFLTFPEDWRPSGLVSSVNSASWDVRLSYDVLGLPSMGVTTVAFGKEFPGTYGAPSTPVSHSGVPVTPGTPYNLSIYPGGYVTISYYQ